MKTIAKEKKIAGGLIHPNSYESTNILKDSLIKSIPEKDHNSLRNISNDYRIYTWWTNLPVVVCKHAKRFLQWVNFNNDSYINTIDYPILFADMIYNYYCVLFHKYRLSIIPNLYHSLEFSHSERVEYVDKNIMKLHWVNAHAYSQNSSYYINNKFHIVFHLDRKQFPQFLE